MAFLQISLFGSFQLHWNGNADSACLSQTIQTLFAYLLINRHRTYPREVLASLLWRDCTQQQARNCLNTAVWRLRHAFECRGIPANTYLLSTPMGELGFNVHSDYWLDVDVFEAQARHTLACPMEQVSQEEIQVLENAIHLYIGELLEGYYDDWALRERERMRCYYLNCLNYLMNYYTIHGLYEISLAYGQQILDLDVLREEIHRQMMHLYMKNGQRALALRQYDVCRQVLSSELGILPMAETQALFQQILLDNIPASQPPGANSSSLCMALDQLQTAIEQLSQAELELRRATLAVKELVQRGD